MTHPVEEVRITATKTFEVLTTTTGSISAAEQSGSTIVFPPEQRRVVQLAGDTWMWVTIALTLVALTRLQAARRATAVWSPVVLLTVSMWGGIGLDRYNQPLVPFLAVFAAAAVAASLAVGRPAGPPTDET